MKLLASEFVNVTTVKVYNIFDDIPAVISVENGFLRKGYLKGCRGIGEYNPVDGISPLDALFIKDVDATLKYKWSARQNGTLLMIAGS